MPTPESRRMKEVDDAAGFGAAAPAAEAAAVSVSILGPAVEWERTLKRLGGDVLTDD